MRMRSLGGIALIRRASLQHVMHADPLDDEHPVFDLDLAFRG
jgi:hypothetical protein